MEANRGRIWIFSGIAQWSTLIVLAIHFATISFICGDFNTLFHGNVLKQLVHAFSCAPLSHSALEFLSYGALKKLHAA